MKKDSSGARRVSDEAVQKATGKKWDQWFKILDAKGAGSLNHTQIAAILFNELKCPGWWNQMVAVEYERARGLRTLHERPKGFEVGVSKTIAAPATALFQAWTDEKQRVQWFPDPLVIHRATPSSSLRATWTDGRKSIAVNFYPKGDSKCQVVVQHGNLQDAKTAARLKKLWSAALSRLGQMVND